jgi:hypothetical protein
MIFEVLTAEKLSILNFWVTTPCVTIFIPEDGDSLFLRNVCTYLQVHTALQPKRQQSTSNILTIYEMMFVTEKEKHTYN